MKLIFKKHNSSCFLITILLFLNHNFIAGTDNSRCPNAGKYYAIVFDAGSSGTRIYVLEFNSVATKAISSTQLKFINQTFIEGKYSLSSCKDDLTKVPKLLEPLLNDAKRLIPKSLWHKTPSAVMATAGLRLIKKNESDAIINVVTRIMTQDVLFLSPFQVHENAISVISGEQEGFYGWFTVNHMLNRLIPFLQTSSNFSKVSVVPTMATIFIGGGSMQVAFLPESPTIRRAPKGSVQWFKIFNQMRQLYSVSYLGKGLVQSRLESLKQANLDNSNSFQSACFPNDTQLEWKHKKVPYLVTGCNNYTYRACFKEQVDFLNNSLFKPTELKNAQIFLSGHSAIFLSDLFKLDDNGGSLTLKQLQDMAPKVCSFATSQGLKEKELWKCRDLSYIISVLKALNLKENTKFLVADKISNMKVRWALGAAYQLLEKYFEEEEIAMCDQ